MKIEIINYKVETIIGVYDFEKEAKRELLVSLKISFDADKAAESDDVKDTIDYDEIGKTIEEVAAEKNRDLLESFSKDLIDSLKAKFPQIKKVKTSITKPGILPKAERVTIINS